MDKVFIIIGIAVTFVTVLVLMSLVFAIPTYYLWNWLMPKLFHLPEVTLFQAWGINFLTSILFKSSSTGKTKNEG